MTVLSLSWESHTGKHDPGLIAKYEKSQRILVVSSNFITCPLILKFCAMHSSNDDVPRLNRGLIWQFKKCACVYFARLLFATDFGSFAIYHIPDWLSIEFLCGSALALCLLSHSTVLSAWNIPTQGPLLQTDTRWTRIGFKAKISNHIHMKL